MSKSKTAESRRIRSHFSEIASQMPKLSHWPDRDKPFDYADSEVCNWLLSNPEIRRWIFDKARNQGLIEFDEESETWIGVNFSS